jgi:hypothetical protein
MDVDKLDRYARAAEEGRCIFADYLDEIPQKSILGFFQQLALQNQDHQMADPGLASLSVVANFGPKPGAESLRLVVRTGEKHMRTIAVALREELHSPLFGFDREISLTICNGPGIALESGLPNDLVNGVPED